MRIWGLSVLANTPLMPGVHATELQRAMRDGGSIAWGACIACADVAPHLPAFETRNLAVVTTVDAPNRRVYLGYPELDEWLRLERGSVTAEDFGADTAWHVMMDALH